MSEEPASPICCELVDNRAAVIREINVTIKHLRDISAQFHNNEGLTRLGMHQELVKQICELAKLVQTAADSKSVILRVSK